MKKVQTVEDVEGENTRTVAFVIDGHIVQLMKTDIKMYSILASDPVIVDVTNRPIAKRGLEPFTQYDIETGKIIPPKEYDSWIYNDELERWDPPIEKPENPVGVFFVWDEESLSWIDAAHMLKDLPDDALPQGFIRS